MGYVSCCAVLCIELLMLPAALLHVLYMGCNTAGMIWIVAYLSNIICTLYHTFTSHSYSKMLWTTFSDKQHSEIKQQMQLG